LWTFVPVLPYDWLLFGERDKFISVSNQRIVSVQPTADILEFQVVAATGAAETLRFSVGRLGSDDVMVAQCSLAADTRANVVCRASSGCVCTPVDD
jgi:hypothetical protein